MEATQVQSKSIPNSLDRSSAALSDDDLRLVDYVTALITPTIEDVADWHFTDVTMAAEWESPLLRVLRFFVENSLSIKKTKRIIDIRDDERSPLAA